jgi:flavin-dependent dehydrogenase
VLKELGVWDRFTRGGHLPSVANQSAWGLPEVQSMDFVFSPFGNGWHVDRARFDRMLQGAAIDAGAALLRRTRVVRIEEAHGRLWQIRTRNGTALHARFLIDATGRPGWLATRIGVRRQQKDRLLASAALFRPLCDQIDNDATTLIEAAPYGWWYTAPLPRRRRVAVCFTAPPVCLRDPDSFVKLATTTQHVARRLDKWRLAAGPFVSIANSSHLQAAAGPAWLAVGDAAAAHDPISSYGILWALRSGMLAADAAPSYLAGDAAALERYDAAVAESVSVYGRGLAEVYASERRWPREPFWAARK